MRVAELKSLARECKLRGYSRMVKPEIIELNRNGPHGPRSVQRTHNQQSWAPDIPPRPNQTQLVRFRPDRPRQPRQPLCTTGQGTSTSLGSLRSKRPEVSVTPTQQEMDIFEQQEMCKSHPQVKNKLELEQAFSGVYRSYRINGRPRMDVETFFHRIRGDLIDLLNES